MIHAQLTKLSTLPEGILDPNGAATGGPLHDGYTVKGYYDKEPEIGQRFVIRRYERNGIHAEGIMSTSPVTLISRDAKGRINWFRTQNSVYLLTPIITSYEQKVQDS